MDLKKLVERKDAVIRVLVLDTDETPLMGKNDVGEPEQCWIDVLTPQSDDWQSSSRRSQQRQLNGIKTSNMDGQRRRRGGAVDVQFNLKAENQEASEQDLAESVIRGWGCFEREDKPFPFNEQNVKWLLKTFRFIREQMLDEAEQPGNVLRS